MPDIIRWQYTDLGRAVLLAAGVAMYLLIDAQICLGEFELGEVVAICDHLILLGLGDLELEILQKALAC